MTVQNRLSALRRPVALIAAVVAGQLAFGISAASAGTTAGAVTISLSGSTAMRNFTINPNFTALTPGTSIALDNGYTYTAAPVDASSGQYPSVQLGAATNDSYPASSPLVNANYYAERVEWHEQGSVEGILEMASDQIGTIQTVAGYNRDPSVGNPTWINGSLGTIAGGFTAAGQVGNAGSIAHSDYNTYNAATFDPATGRNLQGGQNRVQMAISDVKATQGFSYGTNADAAWNRTPGQAGYGKGNAALAFRPATGGGDDVLGLGGNGARHALNDQHVLDMSTDKVDPQSTTGAHYANGAWNTAGVNNVNNTTVAVTATTFAANPGTGLTKVNRTDAQFLQAAGRLGNGADFNVVTRDVNSGTRNVASLDVGLDPSYSVGENDAGDGSLASAVSGQVSIGSGITFSNKTAGGAQLRPTLQNARMGVGHLSISDIRGGGAASTNANPNTAARPLRALAYRDDANDVADGSNANLQAGFADPAAGFVKPSFDSITDGSYVLYQNETYVTVKVPDAVAYTQDAIKGDNAGHDVRDFRDNITQSASQYPLGSSFLNPANGLISQGFIPTEFMKVEKAEDGLNRSSANPNFIVTADPTNGPARFASVKASAQAAFEVADAASITSGTNSTYGNISAASGGVAITAGNYLFGDFDNDGDRDFADVKAALTAQTKLAASGAGVALGTTNDLSVATANAQPIAGLTGGLAGATKGDLIVKGDFNSDGRFDGKDLYLLARGASLADSTSTDSLTAASGATFGDQVRKGVLRKNAALDYLNANASDQLKLDTGGMNVFNKFDVNGDGVIDRKDASIVDKFVGSSITDLGQQIGATIGVDGTVSTTVAQKSISLIDVELQDNLTITSSLPDGGTSDFKLIKDVLGSLLKGGDTNFDGSVNFDDLLTLAQNYNNSVDRWSKGDFDQSGNVGFDDLLTLAQNYQGSGVLDSSLVGGSFANDWALAQSLVPEPMTLTVASVAGVLAGRRRRD